MTNEKKIRFQAIAAGVLLCCTLLSCGTRNTESSDKEQPLLGYRTATILDIDGRTFRDLHRNGQLDAYEGRGLGMLCSNLMRAYGIN